MESRTSVSVLQLERTERVSARGSIKVRDEAPR